MASWKICIARCRTIYSDIVQGLKDDSAGGLDQLSCGPVRLIGCEEGGYSGDVVRLSGSPEWGAFYGRIAALTFHEAGRLQSFRDDEAGVQCIDPDLLRSQLL